MVWRTASLEVEGREKKEGEEGSVGEKSLECRAGALILWCRILIRRIKGQSTPRLRASEGVGTPVAGKRKLVLETFHTSP